MALSLLSSIAPLILIFGGITAISELLARFMRGSIKRVLRNLSIFGFAVGILLLATGMAVLLSQTWNTETWLLLILTALVLMLKPLNRIPWAALFGLIIGIFFVGLIYLYLPLPETILGIPSAWIYLSILLVPALLIYFFFKFWVDLARLISTIMGSRIVMIILGAFCIIQGFLLLFGQSISSIHIF